MARLIDALRTDADLATLVAAWRATPHPRLAALIERRTPSSVEIHGVDQADTIARVEAALAGDAEALGAGLAAFPTGPLAAGRVQLDLLAARPPDPRTAARILALLADPPYRTRKALAWWVDLLAVLERVADPRSHAPLADRVERMDQAFAEPMRTLIRQHAAEVLARLPTAAPALDPADVAAIAQAEARLPAVDTRTVDQLEAAIFDAPGDRDLRLVYADACLRAGDPRGEVISLQARAKLTKDQRTRLKQLLDAGRSAWLGPLERVLLKSSIRFELGFLSEATLKPKHTAHLAPLIDDPRWSTVHSLALAALGTASMDAYAAQDVVHQAVLSPAFRALSRLTGVVQPSLAMALADGDVDRRIEHLEVFDTWPEHRPALRRAFVDARRLPALTALIWRAYGEHTPGEVVVGPAVLERLRVLGLTASARSLPERLAWWAGTGLEVLRLSDVHDHREIRLERSATGRQLYARFRWPGMVIGGRADPLLILCEEALRLAPGTFEAITLRWTRRDAPRPEQRAAIDRMLNHLQASRVSLPSG